MRKIEPTAEERYLVLLDDEYDSKEVILVKDLEEAEHYAREWFYRIISVTLIE